MTMRSLLAILARAALLALLTAGLSGCGKNDEKPKYRTLPGKVTHIDLKTGEVKGHFYVENEHKEMDIAGKLAANAEILIDGKTARLDDVQIDDKVKVTGYVERIDGEPRMVAVKVEIDRGGAEPASAPATEPAK